MKAVAENASEYTLKAAIRPSAKENFTSRKFTLIKTPLDEEEVVPFVGRLEIPDSSLSLPEQNFLLRHSGRRLVIENQPKDFQPKLVFELAADESEVFQMTKVHVKPSADSVEADVEYTRLQLALAESLSMHLHLTEEDILRVRFLPFTESEKQDLVYRAKLFRKLKYVEWVFGVRMTVPTTISPTEAMTIELLYRGLTEGEFTARLDIINAVVSGSQIDWNRPPFREPGPFPQPPRQWHYFGDDHDLLGYRLAVGPSYVRAEKASFAGPANAKPLADSSQEAVSVRFDVLDHQVQIRLEKYAQRSQKQRLQKLRQFKYELSRHEPKEMVDLVDEPLASDVSSDEAAQIAVGWLEYYRFPDRYCPQEPELDRALNAWRVPVYLVYPGGANSQVGELVVDLKTGIVTPSAPVEEMKSQGTALAETLHAHETAPLPAGD
jgi:hypothetical protein